MPKDYEGLLQGGERIFTDESGNLREPILKPLTEKTPFSPESFAKWYENFQKLKTASLGEFGKITYDRENLFSGIEASEAEKGKKYLLGNVYGQSLLTFGRAKSKDLSDLVWSSNQKALAGYVLGTKTFAGENPQYEETRKSFESTKAELDALKKDERGYVTKKMENLDTMTRAFFAPFLQKMVQEETIVLQNKAITTIGEYGFPKFVSENVNAVWKASEKQIKDLKVMVKEKDGTERELTFDEKREALLREGKGIESEAAIPMTLGLADLAYKSYTSKKAADEEAKKKKAAQEGQSQEESEEDEEELREAA